MVNPTLSKLLPQSMRAITIGLTTSTCLACCSLFAQQAELKTENLELLQVDNYFFKDHNKNGRLDGYEDWRLSPEERAAHLVSLMTVEEKAGAMLHGTLPMDQTQAPDEAGYDYPRSEEIIRERNINHLITRIGGKPGKIAEQNNQIQRLAETSRLGIPVTVSTDPRHHFQFTEGASVANAGFSQWPETLGFAALRDPQLVKQFADIARQEYRATGIHYGPVTPGRPEYRTKMVAH